MFSLETDRLIKRANKVVNTLRARWLSIRELDRVIIS